MVLGDSEAAKRDLEVAEIEKQVQDLRQQCHLEAGHERRVGDDFVVCISPWSLASVNSGTQ